MNRSVSWNPLIQGFLATNLVQISKLRVVAVSSKEKVNSNWVDQSNNSQNLGKIKNLSLIILDK